MSGSRHTPGFSFGVRAGGDLPWLDARGNHSLRDLGLHNVARLDYAAVSRKLVGPSEWLATRYYIGQVRQVGGFSRACGPPTGASPATSAGSSPAR